MVSTIPKRSVWLPLLAAVLCSGCASVPSGPPHIDRLPESVSGVQAPSRSGPYTLEDVVAMARAGDPGQVIVQKLRDSRTPYGGLSADQSASLASRGVPADVLVWLRFGDRPASPVPGYGVRNPCFRDPFCRPLGYGSPWAYPYGYGYAPRSGLYFGYRLRR